MHTWNIFSKFANVSLLLNNVIFSVIIHILFGSVTTSDKSWWQIWHWNRLKAYLCYHDYYKIFLFDFVFSYFLFIIENFPWKLSRSFFTIKNTYLHWLKKDESWFEKLTSINKLLSTSWEMFFSFFIFYFLFQNFDLQRKKLPVNWYKWFHTKKLSVT